eukprot:5539939-Pyramimonas_sp.AAC.1
MRVRTRSRAKDQEGQNDTRMTTQGRRGMTIDASMGKDTGHVRIASGRGGGAVEEAGPMTGMAEWRRRAMRT